MDINHKTRFRFTVTFEFDVEASEYDIEKCFNIYKIETIFHLRFILLTVMYVLGEFQEWNQILISRFDVYNLIEVNKNEE